MAAITSTLRGVFLSPAFSCASSCLPPVSLPLSPLLSPPLSVSLFFAVFLAVALFLPAAALPDVFLLFAPRARAWASPWLSARQFPYRTPSSYLAALPPTRRAGPRSPRRRRRKTKPSRAIRFRRSGVSSWAYLRPRCSPARRSTPRTTPRGRRRWPSRSARTTRCTRGGGAPLRAPRGGGNENEDAIRE